MEEDNQKQSENRSDLPDASDIQLRSDEVNDLLTALPHWSIRWGTGVLFIVMLSIFGFAYFIRYPDVITTTVTVTTLNPPVSLIAKSNGKLTHLFVKDKDPVKENQLLAVIENTADYRRILAIDHALQLNLQDSLWKQEFPSQVDSLGELTLAYLQFLKDRNNYQMYISTNPQLQEIAIINKELSIYNSLLTRYAEQEKIYKQEFDLVEKDHQRFLNLFNNQVISAKEYENIKRDYLSAQRAFETYKLNTSNTLITIRGLEKNKIQLQIQAFEQQRKFDQEMKQSAQALRTAIATWKSNYLVLAPVQGKVSFFSFWVANQYIKQGDALMSLVPDQKQEIIAKLILPMRNSGKVKKGQQVNIKLENYPYQEYGMLQGTVKNIAEVPQQKTYSIEVDLPNQLRTTYKKNLPYKEEMIGVADIITEELSVLDRVFYRFREILKK